MGRVDLDQLERRFWEPSNRTTSSDEWAARQQVLSAVTELRASREVIRTLLYGTSIAVTDHPKLAEALRSLIAQSDPVTL